jgi:hypothetical protein
MKKLAAALVFDWVGRGRTLSICGPPAKFAAVRLAGVYRLNS